jgi:transposase-like protein
MENKIKRRRISVKKKTEIVLELLRGASIEELSRQNKVAVHELTRWREQFIENGSLACKKSRNDSKVSELERIIGQQHIEIELLKKKTKGFGKIKDNS